MNSLTKKQKHAKDIERATRLVWDSLQSHLSYTYLKSSEGKRFHVATIKQYAELIEILARLY